MIRIILGYTQAVSDMLSVESLDYLDEFTLDEKTNQWAIEHNFSLSGTFYYKTRSAHVLFSTWMQAQKHTTLLLIYCRQCTTKHSPPETIENKCMEFSTDFVPNTSLSTSNSDSCHVFPVRPNVYKESFTGMPIEMLYQRHIDSIAFLTQKSNLKIRTIDEPVEKVILESMHEDCNYTKSIPFWRIKSVYWYLSRKYTWQNLTIQQQYEKGKIYIPQ